MNLLGVDWGEKRIGLAIAEGSFAEPLGVVGSAEDLKEAIRREGVRQVVLGLPEGKNKKKVESLGRRIEKELGVKVIYRSEVLTSKEALQAAIKSGKGKKARRNLDALAAAILLQEYLDAQVGQPS